MFPESPLCLEILPVILPKLLDRLFFHALFTQDLFFLEEKETKESQPESVEALLDTVENEELLQILLSTDKKTLQMIVLKMMGYAPKEISHHMELPEQTVYTRLRRLREKIKKSMKFE